ncbi:hypothetical protein ACSHUI_00400 [Bacillus subtilis]|uniref:hypothetical protein n=1 Tax=Bacillus subtilis TaxID=1423 RepID=UPI003CF53C3E
MGQKHLVTGKNGNEVTLITGQEYKVEYGGKQRKAVFVALGGNSVSESYCFRFKRAVKTSWGNAKHTFIHKAETNKIIEQI